MKTYLILAACALAAACATNTQTADVDAVEQASTAPAIPPGSQADLEQNAGHRVYFGYDEYTLTAQAQSALRQQAQWLMDNPDVRVQLAGNCDERGTREYNLALGAKRAEAARDFLLSQGVDAARIKTVSYGKERPIEIGSGEAVWSRNRNSTTTVMSASS